MEIEFNSSKSSSITIKKKGEYVIVSTKDIDGVSFISIHGGQHYESLSLRSFSLQSHDFIARCDYYTFLGASNLTNLLDVDVEKTCEWMKGEIITYSEDTDLDQDEVDSLLYEVEDLQSGEYESPKAFSQAFDNSCLPLEENSPFAEQPIPVFEKNKPELVKLWEDIIVPLKRYIEHYQPFGIEFKAINFDINENIPSNMLSMSI